LLRRRSDALIAASGRAPHGRLHLGSRPPAQPGSAPVASGDGVNAPPTTPYQGLDHFGLTVKGIDAVAAELKAKGAVFTKEPITIRPGVRICFLRGPQGISIELLERDAKYGG
jgi:catechol 2,3-dioxygenase-like lactoylglutathione lyase family enzyme